jgi:hypothetical protein
VELSKSFLQLEGTYTISPNLKVYSRWRGDYDASFDFKGQDKLSQEVVDDQRLNNEIRELYVDIRQGPLFLRIGKQQVVWGESDVLRLSDIINPLDFSWHYFLEDWQDIRQGLPWLARSMGWRQDGSGVRLGSGELQAAKWAGVGTYLEFPGAGIGGIPEKEYDTNIKMDPSAGKSRPPGFRIRCLPLRLLSPLRDAHSRTYSTDWNLRTRL